MTLELTSTKSLRETVAAWRAGGESIALVPTMGALHRGHMTLVERAKESAKRVIVSIFVNPTQFGPNEDFDRYPRPLEHDLMMLREEGVDAAWLPNVEEMYPAGFSTSVKAGSASRGFDGDARPGHFNGVATVVTKLLLQVMPDIALFGEKDFQQLCVIKQLVRDLNIPVAIIGVPTVREASGLALSSRNQYLSEKERAIAPKLYAALVELAEQLKQSPAVIPLKNGISGHITTPEFIALDPGLRRDDGLGMLMANAKTQLLSAGFSKIDYLALCDDESLAPLNEYRPGARLLVAAWLGKTRLIDNIAVG